MNPHLHFWLPIAGMAAGYGLLMALNPVRKPLRDGARCLRRFPALWITLAVLGVCYAGFQHVGVRLLENFFLPKEETAFAWAQPWALPYAFRVEAARQAALPAVESVAGLFNNLIATFPFSVAAAVLLLVNWRGGHGVLNQALRRRYGGWGWALYGVLTASALATLLKPFVLYAGLPALARWMPEHLLFPASFAIDRLSFVFEYLLGVGIQVYLILLADTWVRGVGFDPEELFRFAIRRSAAVMKWAVVVLALSGLLIDLPLFAATLPPFWPAAFPTVTAYVSAVARPALAGFLIAFSTLQITLVFHSESLRHALRDHARFLRRNAVPMAWFLVIALVHFYGFHWASQALRLGLGETTGAGLAWQLAAPLPEALLAAWLLASWVCLFQKLRAEGERAEEGIAF
ncbi:MAG: hypothetical protein PHQ12_02855 [Chthoniobacteraceae bacterium]|nr:hypothetical protein [Chthoniobacteraceae bacterium]